MILAIDVQYSEQSAFIGGVLFSDWEAQTPIAEYVSTLHDVEEYVPGNFYKRELPCILRLIDEHKLTPACIVIDGYVYLDGNQKPGLGKRLFDALSNDIEVIGVAKKAFSGIEPNYEIHRGESKNPLYVTTTGDLDAAKRHVSGMFGKHRIPVLLKRADQICRAAANKPATHPCP
ncbi:endonuclease V [Marinobacter zhejiangensis]|uniref:Endonuclease V n=1 Tax=Marinobacter zhejiangensis TaxID=488535 RepID=A0A1I4P4K8_9GAMM|nr:endonuclease V [Marinobacter zhejiangensis]SFM22293.1 Endonuclease V [Marinobacter zhejiangensis]